MSQIQRSQASPVGICPSSPGSLAGGPEGGSGEIDHLATQSHFSDTDSDPSILTTRPSTSLAAHPQGLSLAQELANQPPPVADTSSTSESVSAFIDQQRRLSDRDWDIVMEKVRRERESRLTGIDSSPKVVASQTTSTVWGQGRRRLAQSDELYLRSETETSFKYINGILHRNNGGRW